MNKIVVGSVISGTMRPADLIPAFFDVLHAYDPEAADRVAQDWAEFLGEDVDPNIWQQDSEATDWLLEALFDTLDVIAPAGYYFGSHPGDGSDYGVWPVEE